MSTEVRQIPLTALRESPFNPRSTYDEAKLWDLASSIKDQGILQPLVVRVVPESVNDLYHQYEIVFGHRRFRAAAMAQLDCAPCLVSDYDDLQAAVVQLHENDKRDDVSAIDEADTYLRLTTVHKMTVDAIVQATIKSRSHVYAQLKLARGAPELRKAVVEQGLSPELARAVAKFPHHDLHRAALKQLRVKHMETPERPIVWMSTRDGGNTLRHAFTESVQVDTTEFDPTDAQLLPRPGACTTCPNRAGNNADLTDYGPDICLDRSCFKAKVDEHRRLKVVELRKSGAKVISGDEAKAIMPHEYSSPAGLRDLDSSEWVRAADGSHKRVEYSELIEQQGEAAPAVTHVVNPHNGKVRAYITVEDAKVLVKQVEAAAPDDDAEAEEDDDRPPEVRAVMNYHRWPLMLQAAMEGAAASNWRNGFELRLVARALIEDHEEIDDVVVQLMGWNPEMEALRDSEEHGWTSEREFVARKLDAADDATCARFMVLQAMSRTPFSSGHEEIAKEKLFLAEAYGVDVVAIADPGYTPSPAARSVDGLPTNETLDLGDDSAAQAPAVATPSPNTGGKAAKTRTGKAGAKVSVEAGSAGGGAAQVDAFKEAAL